MLNILVVGGSGQIGSELRSARKLKNFNYSFPDSSILDVTKKKSIKDYFNSNKIDLILNFAAYTKVDKAELEKKIAYSINNDGASNLSIMANRYDIDLFHFSTDYVFGKSQSGIKKPNDDCSPANYYGLTKSLGEKAVLDNMETSSVIRLASVYGEFGDNFVKTMLKLILTQNRVEVINDQKISLTNSKDLVKNIPYLIDFINKNRKPNNRIFHFTNKGYTNWFSVANFIKKEVEFILNSKLSCELVPIKSKQWKSLAKRPLDSRLKVDYKKFEKSKIFLNNWQVGVQKTVKILLPIILDELNYEG